VKPPEFPEKMEKPRKGKTVGVRVLVHRGVVPAAQTGMKRNLNGWQPVGNVGRENGDRYTERKKKGGGKDLTLWHPWDRL